jgi:hypothetical protein
MEPEVQDIQVVCLSGDPVPNMEWSEQEGRHGPGGAGHDVRPEDAREYAGRSGSSAWR